MFENLEPLSATRHARLCYQGNQPFHYAAGSISVPVGVSEAAMVAREYPVVFSLTDDSTVAMPLALLGLEPGKNLHVNDNGQWVGRYVPAHVRRFPFIVAPVKQEQQGESQKTYVILIDRGAPHLSEDAGEALYVDGQPSTVLRKVQHVLTVLQRDFERTAMLVQQLDQLGLLVARHLSVGTEQSRAVTGFRVVDENKFSGLPADALQQLRDSGALALLYAHVHSLSNLRDGLLAQAVGRAVAGTAAQQGSEMSLNLDLVDWNKLN